MGFQLRGALLRTHETGGGGGRLFWGDDLHGLGTLRSLSNVGKVRPKV